MAVPLSDAFAKRAQPTCYPPDSDCLVNGAYAAGYLVAPTISTSVQQSVGFTPLFVVTACCYGEGTLLMLALFGSGRPESIVR